ncbi:hypothetical protein QMK17_03560 [Rhodococcus sp. G-MC3]|uniref:hypothetical protein n=1 Tax=Rhodococcus sp. G-MC3 TaxID=3046209 RepID=UPI0024BA467E|nr:hypothetical protein [Rhodococcus sp. G-MC3]MDJ0392409.1 hypothetical protein [Rhodococcus sp. G-MC3]
MRLPTSWIGQLRLPSALLDQARAVLGRSPRYIDSVGRPGGLAVMTSPDALDGEYPGTVAARILLRIGLYSNGRTAGSISCPTLVQIMADNAVTPASVAIKAALQIKESSVHIHKGGHFDPYVEPCFRSSSTNSCLSYAGWYLSRFARMTRRRPGPVHRPYVGLGVLPIQE